MKMTVGELVALDMPFTWQGHQPVKAPRLVEVRNPISLRPRWYAELWLSNADGESFTRVMLRTDARVEVEV